MHKRMIRNVKLNMGVLFAYSQGVIVPHAQPSVIACLSCEHSIVPIIH